MALPPIYKYLDVQGAKLTLGNRTFKHAKPSTFNDTEDLTIQSIFPEDTEAALKKIADGMTDVILQHLSDPPTCLSPLKEKVALIQHVYRNNPEAADVVKAEKAREGGAPVFDIAQAQSRAEGFVEEINEFMQDYRIFCVTTHKASEEMWSGYAENHKGIALRIEPNLAKDSKYQLFRPVIYREQRPPLYENTIDFMANSLFGDQQANRMETLEKIIYTKTLDWAHESEYRLAIPLGQGEEPWNTLPYHPEEITELYLGNAIEKTDREEIVCKARAVNPDIEIFKAKCGDNGKMDFDHI